MSGNGGERVAACQQETGGGRDSGTAEEVVGEEGQPRVGSQGKNATHRAPLEHPGGPPPHPAPAPGPQASSAEQVPVGKGWKVEAKR